MNLSQLVESKVTLALWDRQDQQMLQAKEEAEVRMREDFDLKLKLLEKDKEESERRYREEAELCMREALMDVRYEEERQRESRRTLEGEAADLRAMLVAMEQSSTDSELRHTASIRELSKVKQNFQNLNIGKNMCTPYSLSEP